MTQNSRDVRKIVMRRLEKYLDFVRSLGASFYALQVIIVLKSISNWLNKLQFINMIRNCISHNYYDNHEINHCGLIGFLLNRVEIF